MNSREFERELFLLIEGFFGNDRWTDQRGRNFDWVMDELALLTTNEQWQIVEDTLSLLRDPDFITGTVPIDTPVIYDFHWEEE